MAFRRSGTRGPWGWWCRRDRVRFLEPARTGLIRGVAGWRGRGLIRGMADWGWTAGWW